MSCKLCNKTEISCHNERHHNIIRQENIVRKISGMIVIFQKVEKECWHSQTKISS